MSYKPYGTAAADFFPPANWQANIDAEAWNEDLVDITSFVPLDLRLKQLERAGVRARLRSSEFSISELRQIYDNHELEYTKDDELEEILDKETKRRELIRQILEKKNSSEVSDSPGVKEVPKENDETPGETTEG